MTKSKLAILMMFVLTLGAGASAGMLYDRVEVRRPTPLLLQELHLTPDQEVKMHDIWTPVSNLHIQRRFQRDTLSKEKDAATLTILNDDQKTRFAEIQKTFDGKAKEVEQSVQTAEDAAVIETNKILDDAQRAKFAEMRKARDEFINKNKPK